MNTSALRQTVRQLALKRGRIPATDIGPRESLPRVTLFRSADLVEVVLSFVGLTIDNRADGPTLRRADGVREGYLCAHFRGQHLHEEAFFEADPDYPVKDPDIDKGKPSTPPTGPPVRTRIAGRSRLVFRVTTERFPYTTAGLLAALRSLPINVVPHAGEAGSRIVVTGGRSAVSVVNADDGRYLSGLIQTAGRTLATAAAIEAQFGESAAAAVLRAAHRGQGTFALSPHLAQELEVRANPGPTVIDLRPPRPRPPTHTETAIELPWRLQLSPNNRAGFTHTIEPATSLDGRVELWHTRLGVRGPRGVDEAVRDDRTVRAVWARDFDELAPQGFGFPASGTGTFPDAAGNQDNPPWRAALNSRDRMMLVHETSNFQLKTSTGRSPYPPPPVNVDRLMLSALGGWLTSSFTTPAPPQGNATIQEWVHRAALGRDSYVKVVYAGFLLPFGHRASLIKVTERKVDPSGVARLFQRMYVVVRERTRSYGNLGKPTYDLAMPFTSVSITTESTPQLDAPRDLTADPPNDVAGLMFTPTLPGGTAFQFHLVGIDLVGRRIEFDGPLVFAEADHNIDGPAQKTCAAYQTAIPVFNLRGQRVAYAPSARADDTSLPTTTMRFDIGLLAGAFNPPFDQTKPSWVSTMKDADTHVPAMGVLAGQTETVSVSYPTGYLASAFTANPAEVFLKLNAAKTLDFSTRSNRSGGFLAPSVAMTGLSRTHGPVGGPVAAYFPGTPTPPLLSAKDFFGSAAKLFGLISLADLMPTTFDTTSIPRFVTQSFDAATMLTANAERLRDLCNHLAAASPAGPASAALDATATAVTTALGALAALVPTDAPPPMAVRRAAALTALADVRAQIAGLAGGVDSDAAILRADRDALSSACSRITDHLGSGPDDIGSVVDLVAKAAAGALLPETLSARLDWSTELQPWPTPGNGAIFAAPDGGPARLAVAVDLQAPTRPGGEPSALVSCAISPFELRLIGDPAFITIAFTRLEFSAVPGRKTDVNVELGRIIFGGPLAFVEALQSVIPLDGFSDPPHLDITPSGIRSGFDLPIPNLAIGIFALTNISLGASFEVPFVGESIAVRFHFSSRESPFRLQIALFAGGGFFAIVITPQEVRELEAALEFGAAVSLDFGVASGSVSVMAGIYFRLKTVDGSTNAQLTGYFRARGEVDVLGLITASIEIYLELTYETASQKAVGRASISVEVSVCMLSFSVSIEVEKKFAGSAGDPTFEQVMGRYPGSPTTTPAPWNDYCDAFAD